jgi:hypothetical protein
VVITKRSILQQWAGKRRKAGGICVAQGEIVVLILIIKGVAPQDAALGGASKCSEPCFFDAIISILNDSASARKTKKSRKQCSLQDFFV